MPVLSNRLAIFPTLNLRWMKGKIIGVILLAAMLLLAGYVINLMYETGYYRDIEHLSPGQIESYINVPGAEDLAISRPERFLLISSDDRSGRRDGQKSQGGIYRVSLDDPQLTPKLLTGSFTKRLHPHGISLFQLDSATYRLLVINHVGDFRDMGLGHTKHYIEEFLLRGDTLIHQKTYEDELILHPNDVVAIGPVQFYFTNSQGARNKLEVYTENYLGWSKSSVVFYDGVSFRKVDDKLPYANGINYDPDRNLIFVTTSRDFQLRVYDRIAGGALEIKELVDCGTGVDNIEIDDSGILWIGAHPDLLTFASFAAGRKNVAPSEVIKVLYREQDSKVETVYMDDGTEVSASSVAIPFGDRLFIGNVMDSRFPVISW